MTEPEVGLKGSLSEMPLRYLLQWMEWRKQSGHLEIRGPEGRVELRFALGRIVEATRSRLQEERSEVELVAAEEREELLSLLREPLGWSEGRFVFRTGAPEAIGAGLGIRPAELLREAESSPREAGRPGTEMASKAWTEESVSSSEAMELQLLLSDRLLRGRYELPVLSEVALKVTRLSRDPGASLKDLSQVVSFDPALSTAVLRYANSAFSSPRQAIDSLPLAVARLGFRTILNLALSVCLYARKIHDAQLRQRQRQLWCHSLGVALLSRHLALRTRLDEEQAFICGLMHDMGKAVILGILDELLLQEKLPSPLSPETLDWLLFEQHCGLGRKLPPRWGLPPYVLHAVAYHHSPHRSPEDRELVAAVSLANEMMNSLEVEGALPEEAPLLATPAAQLLALEADHVESVGSKALECAEQGQRFIE